MSKKGKPLDILGSAHLPADLITPTMGSKYLLDGFEDMSYGLGVIEGLKPQDSPPQANIPSGVEGAGPDLEAFMKEAGVSNLDWLDLQEQDLDRLPENPHYNAIPELEEAWGTENRTNGVYHGKDLEHVRYEESLEEPSSPNYKFSSADLVRVLQRAMRRSAAGTVPKEIVREVVATLGSEAPRVKKALQQVLDEHGLAGNVFIRASAYPGYEQGKWKELLRKTASAKYILVDEDAHRLAHIQEGYCTITKKKAVTAIPWKEAYNHYQPKLVASGYKLASGLNHRAILKAAFLSVPGKTFSHIASDLPKHTTPVERIGGEEARAAFASMSVEERKILDQTASVEAKKRQGAWRKVQAWVDAGLVPLHKAMAVVDDGTSGAVILQRVASLIIASKGASAFSGLPNDVRPKNTLSLKEARAVLQTVPKPQTIEREASDPYAKAHGILNRWKEAGMLRVADHERLVASKANPLDVLKTAGLLVATAGSKAYSGSPNKVAEKSLPVMSREAAWKRLREAETQAQARVEQALLTKRAAKVPGKVAKIAAAVERGVQGEALQGLIQRTFTKGEFKVAYGQLVALVKKAQSDVGTPRQYEGVAYHPVAQKVVSASTAGSREVDAMLRWTRHAMNEGFAGADLDALIDARFASSVKTEGAEKLASLRQEFEGASGFVFVEAAAYATPTGTKGCSEGALKHRANGIRNVLAMDRCASCSLANSLPDGSRMCQEYAKHILDPMDMPDTMSQIKQANIKAANMDDVEQTASLFAPSYNPTEFGLHNASLEDIEFDALPASEKLSKILFSGLRWE